jgi:hypoxanthine phosphoribosyltransferase
VLVSRAQIARRVPVLARQIARRYAGQELTVVAVMTGSLMFLSDLLRRLDLPVRLSLVRVSSYPGTATRARRPQVGPLANDLAGRHVLVVDDVLDRGGTLRVLMERIRRRRPASLHSCVLLRKNLSAQPDDRVAPEFVGFEVPDRFVVGYGLDYDNLYRNLPDVRELQLESRG